MKTMGRRDPENFGGGKIRGARRGGGRRRQRNPPVLKKAADYLDLLARVECAAKCDRPNPRQDHIDRHRDKIIRTLAKEAGQEKP